MREKTAALLALVAGLLLTAPTPALAQACPADCDGSGTLDFFDFLCFQNQFAAGDPEADCDGSGTLDFFDFLCFQNEFAAGCPAGGPTRVDIAGKELLEYPGFQVVDAFNAGEQFAIGVDPSRTPALAARVTADVYVVADRSEAGWAADPTLTDVRGAPQAQVFHGGCCLNSFPLGGSDTLAGPAGVEISARYDLVIDLNRDGLLDDGDVIDGRGDEAGFHVLKDLTALGALARAPALDYAVSWPGIIASRNRQNTVYPADIASMGELPLVVISHGNGHQYIWYDFIQQHLASHGYIVMCNQNDTVPGIETASTTTYLHTDAFLGSLATIGGGVLQGHVDTSRIIWIGHSRGGEGVARAYTRVHDGIVSTQHYDADDVIAVSSIAPNNALGTGQTEPRLVKYHLLWGSADGDISGAPSAGVSSFAIFERAEGDKYSTYVHGADHNDFNCCGFNDFSGPPATEIGRAEAQQVMKATYLALATRAAQGEPVADEVFWRQYEDIRPIGVAQTTTVVNEFRESLDGDDFFIDDFQSEPALDRSSSGGSVDMSVSNAVEVLQSDSDGAYTWTGGQPSNGMTRATGGDTSRGLVFDYTGDSFIEFEVIAPERDFTDDTHLSFRACQGTRHPRTIAELGDLDFTVSLRDGAGVSSSINIGAYAGGIEEPYQRTGAGSGAGWQNEYETIRIRLTDFDAATSPGEGAIDLSDIVAIRFDFGPSFGSSQGRLGLDDIQVVNGRLPLGVDFEVQGMLPEIIAPGATTLITLEIQAGEGESLVAGSPTLRYRFDGGAFQSVSMTSLGDDLYEVELPAPACGDDPEFYFEAEGTTSGVVTFPATAPADVFSAIVANRTNLVSLDFETAVGWTVENIALLDGGWDRGVPEAWGRGDPFADFDGSGQCFLTDNDPFTSNSDVDGGPTRVISPVYDLSSAADPFLTYARWFTNDDRDVDRFDAEISNDGGVSWTSIESVGHENGWQVLTWRIEDFLPLTSQMRFRFSCTDNPNDSVTEGGLDAFAIFELSCP